MRFILDTNNTDARDTDVYYKAPPRYRWVFNKLAICERFGHLCAPAGIGVPRSGYYCIRPITNLMGMGIGSHKQWLEKGESIYRAGYFWCEWFRGRHLSVDYYKGYASSAYEGFKEKNTTWKFNRWSRVDINIPSVIPNELSDLMMFSDWLNVEWIGNKVIEVHIRPTHWIEKKYDEYIVEWEGDNLDLSEDGYEFIPSEDSSVKTRLGFWVKNNS